MPIAFQVELPYQTGTAEDVSINVWHTAATFTSVEDLSDAGVAILAFYEGISSFLSGVLDGSVRIKCYNLADPEPRDPVASFDTPDVLDDAGGPNLPTECAIALTKHGLPLSGQPVARRRGRAYLGPCNTGILESGPGTAPAVADACRTTILNSAQTFGVAMVAAGYPLAIYSRTNDAYVQIKRFSVDDAIDIQRRRGVDPTVRDFSGDVF